MNVSHETKSRLNLARGLYEKNRDTLEHYIDLLLWWNSKVNLMSRHVSRETAREHVVHSLTLAREVAGWANCTFVDAGCGGGLPGIPLSICFPDIAFTENDVVQKKITAVKNILQKLEIKNADTHTGSIEDYPLTGASVIISKHAFKIGALLKMAETKPYKAILLLKGDDYKAELPEQKGLNYEIASSLIDPDMNNPFYSGKTIIQIQRKR